MQRVESLHRMVLTGLVVAGALVLGCGGERVPATVDAGPRDAGGPDAAALDAPGPGEPDGGTELDGGPSDAAASDASGGGADAGDGGLVSMPCAATGACDPFDPASCPLGEGCLLGATGTACMTLAATVAAAGAPCTVTNGCEPGTACLNFGGEGFRCHRMCPDGSIGFCGAGAICSGTLGDACVQVCRPLPARCDIYAQDCADPALACTLVENFETGERYTGCRAPGTRGEGAACGGGMGSCAAGLVCVSLEGAATCRRVCREDGGAPMCAAPEACVGRTSGWGVTYCRVPPP